jgi:hypothetical protein
MSNEGFTSLKNQQEFLPLNSCVKETVHTFSKQGKSSISMSDFLTVQYWEGTLAIERLQEFDIDNGREGPSYCLPH